MSAPQRLSDLLRGIADAPGAQDIVVRGLSLDSRRIRPGDAFVALRGASTHGITFAPAALALGASAVIAETPAPHGNDVAEGHSDFLPPLAGEGAGGKRGATSANAASPRIPNPESPIPIIPIPIIWIDNLRAHVGEIAARFYGRPSEAMRVIGVTGTNGKTSIVQLLASALAALGARAATIGTLGAGMVGAIEQGERTTPDVISVQSLLAAFRDAGATDVAMEVSSHALDQGRVDCVAFALAVFTNLTRDHLDYHGDMAAYGAAKARLFAWPGLHAAVINIDDAFGRELAAGIAREQNAGAAPAAGRTRMQLLRYGVDSADADVRARDVRAGGDGLRFVLLTPWGEGAIASTLLGRFNVANLLAVAASLGALGYTFAQIQAALGQLRPVAGRMNRIGGVRALPLAVVDYAHTPDALEQALTSLRAHCAGRLICVFGCGGERDTGKRPLMGAIAERLADRIVITDDNPRHEDGDAIVRQILAGLARPERAAVQRDRARAIALALGEAHGGDAVLIAGKGHEPYQEVAGVRRPFDDLAVARGVLEARPC